MWLLASASLSAAAAVPFDYCVVIDAGSTGSRSRVYSWSSRVFPTLPEPVTLPTLVPGVPFFTVTPGIDKDAGRVALAQLLKNVTGVPPLSDLSASALAAVPVYLFATAGMRVLPAAARDAALASVRAILAATGLAFSDRQARVISGEEEAVFAWLTANVLAGNVPGQAPWPASGAWLGALDLGGASTQITFVPAAGASILSSFSAVPVGGSLRADVYAHSFLYYGVDSAVARGVQLAASRGLLAANPCYNPSAYPHNLTMFGYNTSATVAVTGAGNFTACVAAVFTPLLARDALCLTDPTPLPAGSVPEAAPPTAPGQQLPINAAAAATTCSIGGVFQPPVAGARFVAFATFSYLAAFLALPSNATTPAALAAAADAHCRKDWATVMAENPAAKSAADLALLERWCAVAAYAYALLVGAYGFAPDTTNITFVPPAQLKDYGWAYGAVLSETNALPWSLAAEVRSDAWRITAAVFIAVSGVEAIGIVVLLILRCTGRAPKVAAVL